MLRYLVTGASGFIGRHLVDWLLHDSRRVVYAWTRSDRSTWASGSVQTAAVDIGDPQAVVEALKVADPDVIIHLAAQSLPGESWQFPIETLRTNVEGTVNLLEAIRTDKARARRVLVAGSSSQYAHDPSGAPLREDAPVDATSPYAVSKVASDQFAKLYARAFGMDVIRFRPFFWIGPGKVGDVASDIASRIVAIERGAPSCLRVGRTDPVRDMMDVRDGVAAIGLLAEKGVSGAAYNVCCGKGRSIADLIQEYATLARVSFDLVSDPTLIRPVDDPVRIGDPSAMLALGWRSHISFKQSLSDILTYWRNRYDQQGPCEH